MSGKNLIKMTELKACFEGLGFKTCVPTSKAAMFFFTLTSQIRPG